MYNLFNLHLNKHISNDYLKKNLIIFMKILIPIAPHIALECLEKLNEKKIDDWPKVNKENLEENVIKIIVQINGKTRNVIETKKDLNEENLVKIIKIDNKIKKFIENKDIKKIIFVKNKLINFVIT